MAHLMKCYIKDEDAISLSIQQLACLNIILAGQFWSSQPPLKTNMQIIRLTFVLSSLFVLLIQAAPILVSVREISTPHFIYNGG